MKKGRPPIVTVLGHVDHGKTSLLDAIRKSNIAGREAGGITQSIGASVITTQDGKKITFVDTPGHAAFSQMRSRGAKVADIVILVVAADDGVKPQTQEALTHIKEAKVPFIVAFTKKDLPSADVDLALGQLEKEGVIFEGRGGDTPYATVSAKTGEGVKELIELITLLSEVNEIKADPEGQLEAVVIETSKSKKGMLVSVVVRDGTLSVGDPIEAEQINAKVRGLFSWTGEPIKEVFPGDPTQIIGFDRLPPVGSVVLKGSGKHALIDEKMTSLTRAELKERKGAKVIIKANHTGSLEAILASTPPEIVIISSGVGDVNQNDIFMAKDAKAEIFTFELKVSSQVEKLAKTEGVKISNFKIIYELFQAFEDILKKGRDEILGKAEIVAIFPYEDGKVAGCKVIEGRINKNDSLKLSRRGKEIGKTKIVSLKRQKVNIDEAKSGEECGILTDPQLDFAIGDVLISVANK